MSKLINKMPELIECEVVNNLTHKKYITIKWDTSHTIRTQEHFAEFCELVYSFIIKGMPTVSRKLSDKLSPIIINNLSYDNMSAYNAVVGGQALLPYLVEHHPDEEWTWNFIHSVLLSGLEYGKDYINLSTMVQNTTNPSIAQGTKIIEMICEQFSTPHKNSKIYEKLGTIQCFISSYYEQLFHSPSSLYNPDDNQTMDDQATIADLDVASLDQLSGIFNSLSAQEKAEIIDSPEMDKLIKFLNEQGVVAEPVTPIDDQIMDDQAVGADLDIATLASSMTQLDQNSLISLALTLDDNILEKVINYLIPTNVEQNIMIPEANESQKLLDDQNNNSTTLLSKNQLLSLPITPKTSFAMLLNTSFAMLLNDDDDNNLPSSYNLGNDQAVARCMTLSKVPQDTSKKHSILNDILTGNGQYYDQYVDAIGENEQSA